MRAVKNKTLAKLPMLIAAGMGIIPADSVGSNNLPIMHSEPTIYEHVSDQLISMPIEDATTLMHGRIERMQRHLNSIKKEWEQNNFIPIRPNKNRIGSQYRYYIELHVTNMTETLDVVKKALNNIGIGDSNEAEKVSLIAYGRAVSLYITTCKNIVSFIEQTHSPKKTTDAKLNVTDADVKKLIRSEHEKLGLGKPSFDMASTNG